MRKPTQRQIWLANQEILEEDQEEDLKMHLSSNPRSRKISWKKAPMLPSEHPDHVCGILCDGQAGPTSYCYRLRQKLFGKKKKASFRNQKVVDQMLRLINGTCPVHGVPLHQVALDAMRGPIEECPRRNCGWRWVGEFPTADANLSEVAEKIADGFSYRKRKQHVR